MTDHFIGRILPFFARFVVWAGLTLTGALVVATIKIQSPQSSRINPEIKFLVKMLKVLRKK